ncbi:MAG: WYL domain-containing protein [Oscillospiraceae bacterium]|nr:WYL domain-containing protein [Oscillospiraceae bacterium]
MEKDNKKRLMLLQQVLEKYSDEEHPLTTNQIISLLDREHGMKVHRTTIPKDVEHLQEMDVDVQSIRTTQNRYFIGDRFFELPQLKLLIDAVASSKFISDKKSKELIAKLDSFASIYQQDEIKRNIYIESRIKADNEHILYIVDSINRAINKGKKISFTYFEYDADKQKCLRNNGMPYILSPYTLLWNGDYYYVVGFSDKHQNISAFRVDRIHGLPQVTEENCVPMPQDFDLAYYTKEVFQMYDAQHEVITLLCENEMMKVIIDRFGADVQTKRVDDGHFAVVTEVALSPNFFGWLFGFGDKIQLKEPENVVEMYRRMLETEITGL